MTATVAQPDVIPLAPTRPQPWAFIPFLAAYLTAEEASRYSSALRCSAEMERLLTDARAGLSRVEAESVRLIREASR